MPLKKYWGKISIISAVCASFDMITHAFWAPLYDYSPPSYLVVHNLFKPAAAIALLISYVFLALVFIYIQSNLHGKKLAKGWRFGIAFGGLWFFGIIGVSLLFNSPLKHEAITGILDCLTVILLGLLLGKYVAEDSGESRQETSWKIIAPIFIIGIIYFIGRYFAYRFFNIELAYAAKLYGTLLWTLALGLWLGLVYELLRSAVNNYSPVKKALIFGGVIFGIDWLLFNFFAILFVAVSPWELLLQAGTDIILLIISIFVFEKFIVKSGHICSAEFSGALDMGIRKLVHNPEKILQDYIKDGMAVLDIGCGPGFFTLEMARMVGGAGKVIAADLQAEMLGKLKNKIKGGELGKRIILHQTAADTIGIAQEVDFVLVFYMLHEASEQKKLLEQIKSILKPGGKILLAEPKFHVSKKMFKNSVDIAAGLGFQIIETPKIFFSRAVVFKK